MRPETTEYAPFFGRYIDLVQGDVMVAFEAELNRSLELYGAISEDRAGFRYAPDKWSIRQVLGHVIDTERVFAYRALRFGRNDPAELASMDQDVFMAGSAFDDIPLHLLCIEFAAVRQATLHFYRNLPPEAWARAGKAGGNNMSVRALAFMIAGHDLHHRELVRGRYLAAIE